MGEQTRIEAERDALLAAGKAMHGAMSALVMAIVMGQPLGPIEARVNAATDAMKSAIDLAEGRSQMPEGR